MSRLLTCLFTGAGYNKMKSEHGITACAKRENIDAISKAVTHYAFRNGPVEDMHANGQLSQQDMKTLNKYMVNRIAGLLSAAMDGSWLQLEQLFSYYRFFGGDWDAAEPDMGEMKLLMERLKKL